MSKVRNASRNIYGNITLYSGYNDPIEFEFKAKEDAAYLIEGWTNNMLDVEYFFDVKAGFAIKLMFKYSIYRIDIIKMANNKAERTTSFIIENHKGLN